MGVLGGGGGGGRSGLGPGLGLLARDQERTVATEILPHLHTYLPKDVLTS